ncbi:MAG: hypothetical protein ACYSX0_22200 [Planctomycetota bacterium]|jgi:hypothetical protein
MNVVDGLPTECPNNPAHTITAAKTGDLESREYTYFEDTSDPTSSENEAAGYKTLDQWKNTSTKQLFFLVHAPTGKWVKLADLIGSSVSDIQIPMIKDNTTPWVEYGQVYYQGVEFIFPGTDRRGPPTVIKMIARAKDSGKSADLRVYDFTNSQVIVEKLGITNTEFAIIDLGDIDNLPTGEARWIAQGKKPASGGTNAQIKLCYVGY